MSKHKYYHHDIAEFRNETRRFTFEEKGIYIDIIDEFYERGGEPIPINTLDACAYLNIKPTKRIKERVVKILNSNFILTESGYIHTEMIKKIKRLT